MIRAPTPSTSVPRPSGSMTRLSTTREKEHPPGNPAARASHAGAPGRAAEVRRRRSSRGWPAEHPPTGKSAEEPRQRAGRRRGWRVASRHRPGAPGHPRRSTWYRRPMPYAALTRPRGPSPRGDRRCDRPVPRCARAPHPRPTSPALDEYRSDDLVAAAGDSIHDQASAPTGMTGGEDQNGIPLAERGPLDRRWVEFGDRGGVDEVGVLSDDLVSRPTNTRSASLPGDMVELFVADQLPARVDAAEEGTPSSRRTSEAERRALSDVHAAGRASPSRARGHRG